MALKLVKNTPETAISKKAAIMKWLGPCASVACLIHCFLLSAILLIAPTFYHELHVANLHQLELAFWAIALLAGLYTLKHASVNGKLIGIFALISIPGIVGYSLHNEEMVHGTLIAMAIYQFSLVLYQHIRSRRLNELECCHNHEHSEA